MSYPFSKPTLGHFNHRPEDYKGINYASSPYFGTTIRPLNYTTPIDLTLQMRRRNNINIHQQADSSMIGTVITDMDHFPYKRWFASDVRSDHPIVDDREAGWRVRRDFLYENTDTLYNEHDLYPSHLFQAPCNTLIPLDQDPTQAHIRNLHIPFPP